jgi:signal transduction histidine kinase
MVSLQVHGGKLFVCVFDKGSGFDMKELIHNEGLGVRAMEERACLLGGEFKIQSAPGKGTSVNAWVPLAPNSFGGEGSLL